MARRVRCAVLQLGQRRTYRENLDRIVQHLDRLDDRELIVAPEVCLSDYDYAHLPEAAAFGDEAERELCRKIDATRTLVLTRLARRGEHYVNEAIVVHDHRIVHRQAKHRLFGLGEEDRHLVPGAIDEIVPFEIGGVKMGILICFELRFKELWKRLEGCELILVPAQWGLARKRHLEILSSALAVMNQCYVLVADSAREDMARASGFCSPDGGVVREDLAEVLCWDVDRTLIAKIRRYLSMR